LFCFALHLENKLNAMQNKTKQNKNKYTNTGGGGTCLNSFLCKYWFLFCFALHLENKLNAMQNKTKQNKNKYTNLGKLAQIVIWNEARLR